MVVHFLHYCMVPLCYLCLPVTRKCYVLRALAVAAKCALLAEVAGAVRYNHLLALQNAFANPGGVIALKSARVRLLAFSHSGGFGAAHANVFTFPLLYRFVIPSGISWTDFRGSLKYPQISVGFTAISPNSHCRNVNFGLPINCLSNPTGFSIAQNFSFC